MNRTQAKWLIDNWDMVESLGLKGTFNVENKSMIEAFASGKPVEYINNPYETGNELIGFTESPHLYRIRPEEKYVEFELDDLKALVDANTVLKRDGSLGQPSGLNTFMADGGSVYRTTSVTQQTSCCVAGSSQTASRAAN